MKLGTPFFDENRIFSGSHCEEKSPNLTKLSHYSHGRVTWECYAIEELKEMVGNRHKSCHSLPPEKGEQYGNYTGRAFVQGLWKGRE